MPLWCALSEGSAFAYTLTLCPAAMFAILFAFEKGLILPGVRLEFLVESHLVLAGGLALLWGLAGF
jgi:4-hydroxy-3-methylbut-2-enyl diphosphate reductase